MNPALLDRSTAGWRDLLALWIDDSKQGDPFNQQYTVFFFASPDILSLTRNHCAVGRFTFYLYVSQFPRLALRLHDQSGLIVLVNHQDTGHEPVPNPHHPIHEGSR